MKFRDKKWRKLGQSTAEYATLVLLVIGAVTVMQLFLKRGQQAAIRYVTLNHLISAGSNVLDGTVQFEPPYQDSNLAFSKESTGFVEIKGGGGTHVYDHSTTRLNKGIAGADYERTLAANQTADMTAWGWNVTLNELP